MDRNAPSDTASTAAPRRWFYGAAVILMLIGVTAAFFEKGYESNVAITVAKRIASGVQETDEHRNSVQQIIQNAERWQFLSLTAVFLAMVSWSIAAWRREKLCGAWVVVVSSLALYILLELMMV
jgi:cation transport ATPase